MESPPTDDGTARGAVTRVLEAVRRGEPRAADELLPLVYDELRRLAAARLAREAPGQTLQPTALVHEAYLRLVGPDPARPWDGQGPFLRRGGRGHATHPDRPRPRSQAAQAGRRPHPPASRPRRPHRRGRLARRPASTSTRPSAGSRPIDARGAELVKLRLYAGLSLDEAAAALGVVRRTAERDWAFARAWLFRQLVPPDGE